METIEQRSRSWPWNWINLAGVLFNIIGIALYVWLCSAWWKHAAFEPETGDVDVAVASVWSETALPVFLLCALVDLVWLVLIALCLRPPLLWRSCLALVVVVAGWVGCWWYSRAHFNGESLSFSPPAKASVPNHALQRTGRAGGLVPSSELASALPVAELGGVRPYVRPRSNLAP